MSYGRNLRIIMALSATAVAVTFAPSSAQAAVCNEASNGQQGGSYVVTGATIDPSIPARYQTGLKPLPANGTSQGLAKAAEMSPALSQCGLPDPGVGPGDFVS